LTGARVAGYKRPVRVRLERIVVVAAMAVAALNIWTGAPLLGLWVGSRLAGDSGLSMLAVLAVVVIMGAACLGLVRVLAVLGATTTASAAGRGRSAGTCRGCGACAPSARMRRRMASTP
jgi:hypothetical protein